MAVVSQEMILEYMRKKGGKVKNVDLVKHFRKHLSFEDKTRKEQARELFKETVNSVAVIRQEEGEKFLYLKEEYSTSNQQNHTSTIVLQPSTRIPEPHPSATPTKPVNSLQQKTSQSSNLGRPTDLANGRPLSTVSPQPSPSKISPVPQVGGPVSQYQYQNGTSEFQNMEEKSVSSTKRKSPVPAPKPSDRSSPHRGISPPHQVSNRGMSPPHQNPDRVLSSPSRSPYRSISPSLNNPVIGRIPEDQPKSNSPRVLSPPHHHTSPRVLSSPKRVTHNGNTEAIPTQSSNSRHHPTSSSSIPYSQSPRHSYQPHPSQLHQPTSNPPQSQFGTTGRSTGKKRIEISGPVNVTPLSNGPSLSNSANIVQGSSIHQSIPYSVAGSVPGSTGLLSTSLESKDMSSMLEHYTSELENIGLSPFTSPHSFTETASLEEPPHRELNISHHPGSSENSSLSSTSALSTHSPPPTDITSTQAHPKVGHKISQTGVVGVQKLIQQYTVPPGAVPTSPPSDTLLLSPSKQSKVGRSSSSVSNHNTNVVFRRQHTPPDSKVQRSQSNVGNIQYRRSRLLERNSTLDTLTRQSIKGTHAVHRQSKSSDELLPSASKEELLQSEDHDRDSPVNEREDDYGCTFDIEPLEKEWVQALITSNMAEIHRILMTDSSIVNKKGFLHGWCALHWAVKNGNEEIIRSLLMSGGKVDIRSNGGLTPLHIAAECGNEKVIRMLVFEYNASTNIRDHSGRRPIDVLHPFAPENMRNTLRTGLEDIPGFRNESLAIAMGSVRSSNLGQTANAFHIPRSGTQSAATLRRNWNSTGHLIDNQLPDKASVRRSQLSPRVARKGFSFRRKKYQVNVREKRDSSSQSEYYHERKDS